MAKSYDGNMEKKYMGIKKRKKGLANCLYGTSLFMSA
jgi:hypothetical protein